MIEAFRKRPWLLIVILLGVFLGLGLLFVAIAIANPPTMVD